MQAKLTDTEAIELLKTRTDIIPVSINQENGRITWQSIGTYHIYEGEFHSAINTVRALQMRGNAKPCNQRFETSITVLDETELTSDCVQPTGFIFHTSRCGSTLLARALARDRQAMVYGEPMLPLHFLLRCLRLFGMEGLRTAETKQRLRNIILLMGRRRNESYCRYVIKFQAIGIHFANIMSAAFNHVPQLFLYRKPVEVLTSLEKRASGWDATFNSSFADFLSDYSLTPNVQLQEYRAHILQKIYATALETTTCGAFLNYSTLKTENLNTILAFFSHTVSDDVKANMERVFSVYSKSPYLNRPFDTSNFELETMTEFKPDSPVLDLLTNLYEEVASSPRNLIPNELSSA